MKLLIAVLFTITLAAGNANAQYVRAKQQARELNDKINARHAAAEEDTSPKSDAPRPAQPQPAPQPVAAPIKPSTQQQAATKLKADIAAARTKGEATDEMKKQFVQDLAAAAMGHSQPSAASLAKFGEGLIAAVAGKNLTATDDAKLVKALVISLNSAGLSSSRLQELNDEIQGVLTKAGVPAGDAGLVGQNLGAVVTDIQSAARR